MAAPKIISPDMQIEIVKGFGSTFGLFIVDDVVRAAENTVAYFTDSNGDYTENPVFATPEPGAQWVQSPINDGNGNIVGSNNVLLNPNGDIVIQFTNALQGSGVAQQGPDFNTQLKAIAPDIASDPVLKDAVSKALPEKTKETLASADISEQYESLSDVEKAAVDEASNGGDNVANEGLKKAFKKANSRADHARVSAERHEWDYCVRKSKYWPLFKNLGGTGSPGIKYVGVDKVTGSDGVEDAPPFWAWCRYPDLRKLFWVARRINRELGRCGGKKLWEALGHASKDDALKDALINNAEWQALKNTLVADVNFAASP